MEGEALNTTERARDESAAEFPEPKRLREADAIIEILDSNDEDDSAVEVIEISDDDEVDISAMVLGCLRETPPLAESTLLSSSMDRGEVIDIADDDEAEAVGSDGIWDSLDDIPIDRRRYESLESGFLTEIDDGGVIGLFDFPELGF